MPRTSTLGTVVPVDRLELRYAARSWPFALARRAEIDAHFAQRRAALPAMFNGQVLLMHRHRLAGGVLEGEFLSTDFASFMSWRDWGFPEAGVINCFSMGALRGSDGAWLLGVMGPHTSAAGRIYFPAGTPDPGDVVDGIVDLAGSVSREVAEETGLRDDEFVSRDGWLCVPEGPRLALMKVLDAPVPAEVLRRRVLEHLAREPAPELADIRIVRGRDDLDPMMPSFVVTFLEAMWSRPC